MTQVLIAAQSRDTSELDTWFEEEAPSLACDTPDGTPLAALELPSLGTE
ncbi:MAG TPA: hypothetical protein VFK52_00855 [Nocardioidaceae bacterium]|nr:hypothetical protein [Nocardioidaceae bacterium]